MADTAAAFVSAWFGVQFEGGVSGAFRECMGMDSEVAIVEYKASGPDGKFVHQKVPGRMTWHDITLRRGVTDSKEFWEWRQKVQDGDMDGARKNGTITLYKPDGSAVARWSFTEAWPSKITGPSFNASTNDVAIEELTITHTGYTRTD